MNSFSATRSLWNKTKCLTLLCLIRHVTYLFEAFWAFIPSSEILFPSLCSDSFKGGNRISNDGIKVSKRGKSIRKRGHVKEQTKYGKKLCHILSVLHV